MKKTKLLLPLTAITTFSAIAPMAALTSCGNKEVAPDPVNFVTDSWATLVNACKDACTFYNAYVKGTGEEKITSEEQAILLIRQAIIESVSVITDPSTQTYRFERTIPVKTGVGEVELKIRLIDVGKDVAASGSGKTTFTFEFTNIANIGVFDTGGNNWVYGDNFEYSSVIRTYLSEMFPYTIPDEVRQAIVPVKKRNNLSKTEGSSDWKETTETAFILEKQEFGMAESTYTSYNPNKYAYTFYAHIYNGFKNGIFSKSIYDLEGTTMSVWTRTPEVAHLKTNNYVWDYTNQKVVGVWRARGYGISPVFNL